MSNPEISSQALAVRAQGQGYLPALINRQPRHDYIEDIIVQKGFLYLDTRATWQDLPTGHVKAAFPDDAYASLGVIRALEKMGIPIGSCTVSSDRSQNEFYITVSAATKAIIQEQLAAREAAANNLGPRR